MDDELLDEREAQAQEADEKMRESLAHEALIWQDVLMTPSGREFFMGILRYLGFGQTTFDLNDRKEIAASALKDAADALLARAMAHDRASAAQMLKEFY